MAPLLPSSTVAWIAPIGVTPFAAVAQNPTLPLPTSAPSNTSAPAALPADPQALLILAANSNGLYGDNIHPWHLKASFERIDKDGKTTDQGTLEVLWAGPKKSKRVYVSNGFHQTDYTTDKGIFQTGESKILPSQLDVMLQAWLNPVPNEKQMQSYDLEAKQSQLGGAKLTCIALKRRPDNQELTAIAAQLLCFSPDKPILRVSTAAMPTTQAPTAATQTIFNKTILFQGRYISSDLRVNGIDGDALKAHIDSLALLPTASEAEITPPSDAKLVPAMVAISNAAATGMLIKRVTPTYPDAAKIMRTNGTVVIHAVIGKDGHIHDAEVLSGPNVLRLAALDAVKQWEYKPYLLNGQPVAVDTVVNVMFQGLQR